MSLHLDADDGAFEVVVSRGTRSVAGTDTARVDMYVETESVSTKPYH